jgi:hypothetical protein
VKRLALVCLAFALVLLTALPASATMALTYDYFEVNSFPGPDWCYHEDSSHIRNWQGTLAPGDSFTVPLRFCTWDESPSGPAGTGFMYKATFWDGHQSISLHAVFPDGTVRQAHPTYPGVLWGCVMPAVKPSYRPEGTIVQPIDPGIYQVVLTNTGSRTISSKNPLQETIWVTQGYLDYQQASCPPEDQNIVPA